MIHKFSLHSASENSHCQLPLCLGISSRRRRFVRTKTRLHIEVRLHPSSSNGLIIPIFTPLPGYAKSLNRKRA